MKRLYSSDWFRQLVIRSAADAVLVNLALFIALIWRLAFGALYRDMAITEELIVDYGMTYLANAPLLTLISLTVFYLSGFYTYGRVYRSKYKALIIVQAVSVSFLIFASQQHIFGGIDALIRMASVHRSALFVAWGLTIGFVVVARLWSSVWMLVQQVDHRIVPAASTRSTPRVLVIGGAGYIGSALLPKLLDEGYDVRVLDLLLYGKDPIRDVIDHPRLELIEGDFRRIDAVVNAMRDVDTVVHLGAIVGDPACAFDEDLTIDVNLNATRTVAEVAKSSGVGRFIFASTCSVYGASEEILNERSELNPVSLYARSKIACERGLKTMTGPNFATPILRFGTIYGVSGRIRFDLVVNLLAAKAKLEGIITVFGGNQWRPFVHVDDAAQAILLTVKAPAEVVGRRTFNVGSNEQNYTIQDVADIIYQRVPAEMSSSPSSDPRNYRVVFDKIRNALDFQPKWTLEEGVEQVLEAIATDDITDYTEPKYSNERFLKQFGVDRFAQSLENPFHMRFDKTTIESGNDN